MCGVIGAISFKGVDVTPFILEISTNLENRGQDSVGLATGNSKDLTRPSRIWKKPGSASEWFGTEEKIEHILSKLFGDVGLGHVRYATASERDELNAQPHYFDHGGDMLLVASNGDIPFCVEERKALIELGYPFESECDAEVIVKHLGHKIWSENKSEEDAFIEVGKTLSAAFSLVALTPSRRLFAMRDPLGFRPLWFCKNEEGFYVCSEPGLLRKLGKVEEIKPGTLVVASPDGKVDFYRFLEARPRFCLMEILYFARPDNLFGNRKLVQLRRRFGYKIAEIWKKLDYPIPDIITSVPFSGDPAAQGCAIGLGRPYVGVILKDRFAGRIFQKKEVDRRQAIWIKYSVDSEEVKGKIIMIVDDTIVRGDQSEIIVTKARDAGAKEVYYASTGPPFINGCFCGLNTPDPDRLIAHGRSVEEVRQRIGADKLFYLPLEAIYEVLGNKDVCTGCFTGNYPIPVPTRKSEV